jgi:transcriptional regulator with GAF, ATPase, and Fis domain
VLARAVHYNGPRKKAPFVDVNCAAIPENLLESELFGHEKGAFTDASAAKPGLFEMANGGTIFLDEIGHLSLPLQGKLLRVLEQREIRRVGGTTTMAVDVRVIAATHVDLAEASRRGEFREDLYYRLAVVPITAPPLRHRRGDVAALAEHFVQQLGGAAAAPLSPSAIAALEAYAWPGNIRELRNVVERSLALGVDAGQLVAPIDDAVRTTLGHDAFGFEPGRSFRETKEAWNELLERRYLRWLYDRAEGNVSKAARDADMDRKYLHKLLRRYGITAADGGEGDGEAES